MADGRAGIVYLFALLEVLHIIANIFYYPSAVESNDLW